MPVVDTQQAFAKAQEIFYANVQGQQLMCDIYQAYAGPDDDKHNCLGCNFNGLTDQINKLLRMLGQNEESEYHEGMSLFSHLINCVWERITDIFDILGVPESYRCKHFQAFIRMRRWANFFKHPKEFGWLVHHPIYVVDGSAEATDYLAKKAEYKIVEDDFLKKYYSADRCKGLAGEFKNFKEKVVVPLPDVEKIVEDIAKELKTFVDVVTNNPVYFEILNDKSTIINYYETEPATTTTVTTTTTTTPPPCAETC